jgi:glycosyltransferase involved in cell wall biosynthesis
VHARNAGIEAADGTWLGFCDDDDLWAPGKLVEQLRAAAHSQRRWAVAGALGFEVDGSIRNVNNPPPGPEVTALLPWRNGIPGGCSNVVVRRDLLRDAGGFDPRLRVLADWELWIRLARHEPPATVSSPLVGYRLHASNMSNDSRGVYAEFCLVEQLSQDLRGGLPIDPHWFHHWIAYSALRARRRRTAAVGYARAATLADPKPLLASAAALMLSERGWKQVRRLRNRRRPRPPAPPWLDELLARERQSQPE